MDELLPFTPPKIFCMPACDAAAIMRQEGRDDGVPEQLDLLGDQLVVFRDGTVSLLEDEI